MLHSVRPSVRPSVCQMLELVAHDRKTVVGSSYSAKIFQAARETDDDSLSRSKVRGQGHHQRQLHGDRSIPCQSWFSLQFAFTEVL